MSSEKIAAARAAQAEARAAEHRYFEALATAYPVGTYAYYSHGDNWVYCEVIGHVRDDLRVRGMNSGKEYLVNGYRFHG